MVVIDKRNKKLNEKVLLFIPGYVDTYHHDTVLNEFDLFSGYDVKMIQISVVVVSFCLEYLRKIEGPHCSSVVTVPLDSTRKTCFSGAFSATDS